MLHPKLPRHFDSLKSLFGWLMARAYHLNLFDRRAVDRHTRCCCLEGDSLSSIQHSVTLEDDFFCPRVSFDFEKSSASNNLMASSDVKPSSKSLAAASSPILFSEVHCNTNCSGVKVVISTTFFVGFSIVM